MPDRRLALRVALKLLSAAAAVGVLIVVLRLFGVGAVQEGTGQRVDLEGLAPGAMLEVNWAGRQVLVLHRTQAMIESVLAGDALVRSPRGGSRIARGTAVDPRLRSRSERYFVALAYDTALGCPLDLVTDPGQDTQWPGGFRDRCGGSRYDFAGRVLEGERALRNLDIPDYRMSGPTTLLLGLSPD
jgi:ubiquinol-cytochrome c reductase iron-sulfur subunit